MTEIRAISVITAWLIDSKHPVVLQIGQLLTFQSICSREIAVHSFSLNNENSCIHHHQYLWEVGMSQRVIITGASSGIGEALAHRFAANGFDVGICARRKQKLDNICQTLKRQYPDQRFYTQTLDVNQLDQVSSRIAELAEQLESVDIVIANAGITGKRRTGNGDVDRDAHILQTNLLGSIATIDAAIAIFRQQDFGHLVGISSFSAYRGIPGSAAYSSSKAALSNYLDAVRTEFHKKRIKITTIHPGFIATDISQDMDKYPFVISAQRASELIYRAIKTGKKEATVPRWPWAPLKHIIKVLPAATLARVF